ncbi:MAG TPA: hypothetical protein VIT90_14390 [Lysobacter sp.]
MQPNTDMTPAAAQPLAIPGTGAAAQATTAPADADLLQAYTLASTGHLDALAARLRAEEAERRALAKAHRLDPFMPPADRLALALNADQHADEAAERALHAQQRADALRAAFPTMVDAPMAVVVITVQRDRIQQTARLVMGYPLTATRTWSRFGTHSWKSRDPEWSAHEDRIGIELVEYMDALDLPQRIADLLPRPPSAGTDAAAKAAREVAHG